MNHFNPSLLEGRGHIHCASFHCLIAWMPKHQSQTNTEQQTLTCLQYICYTHGTPTTAISQHILYSLIPSSIPDSPQLQYEELETSWLIHISFSNMSNPWPSQPWLRLAAYPGSHAELWRPGYEARPRQPSQYSPMTNHAPLSTVPKHRPD